MVIVICTCVWGQSTKITGEYSYSYGDNESLLEAKSLCYTMALRNAIESYTVWIQSTTTIQDFKLKNDLIQAISSGYIDRLTVDLEKIEGRNVHYKISGYVNPASVKNVIDNIVQKSKGKEPPPVAQNRCIKILKVKDDGNRVRIVFKYLQRYSCSAYGSAGYNDSFFDCYKIFIDYYDEQGDPIGGDSKCEEPIIRVKRTVGEISTITFYKPNGAKSYRVRVF
jgi:hypothetical protein